MKLLGRLFALGFTLLTALLVFSVYLLHSPNGLVWTYRFAAVLLPGELTIEHIEGRLRGPFTLRGIHYRNDKMDLQMGEFALQWRPGDLMEGRLQIDDLAVTGLHIVNVPSTDKTGALPNISLPIGVVIDRAALRDLSIAEQGKDPSFGLTEATLTQAAFKRHQLQLQRLVVTAPHYRFTAKGDLRPQRDYPLDVDVQWSADGGEYGNLAGQAHISGDLQQLKIHHQLTSPVRAELNGTIVDALTDLRWRAELNAPEVKLQTLRAQWPALTLGGKLRGNGSLQRIQAEGELHSSYQSLNADHRFALVYEKDVLHLNRFDTRVAKSGAQLSVHGTLGNLAKQPRAALEGAWRNIGWPLQEQVAIRSDAGHFSLAGTMDRYQVQAEGDLAGPQVPAGNWSLSANGTPQALTVTKLEAKLLDGTVTGNGKLSLQTPLAWDVAVQGSHLNPGVQWSDWPGRLAFAAHGKGDIKDGIAHAQVELSQVKGDLKNFQLDGDGVLNMTGDRLELAKLRIDSGANHFTASGSLQDNWAVQWQITAADLTHLLPGSAGRLQGSGGVSGPRDNPMFTASLIGQQLHYADKKVGEIDLVMAVDTQGHLPSTIEIEAQDAALGDKRIDTLRLRGDGNAQHHQLQISATAADSSLALNVDGRYVQQKWTGTVVDLDMDAPVAGRWQLADPVQADFDRSAAHLDKLCLKQDKARFCSEAHWSEQNGWQTQASLRDVPLSLIKDWMPAGTTLTGDLDADALAGADAGGLIKATAEARLKAGVVTPPVSGKNEAPAIVYHQGQINLNLDERSFTTRIQFDLADGGNLQGSVTVQRIALPAPLGAGQTSLDTALFGQLQGDVKDLSLLPALIPGVEHTQGHLITTLSITGSLDSPRLIGEVRLENGSAAIPALGISPDAINMVARGDEQGHLRIDARLRSKGGNLRLGGDLHYDKASGLNIQAQLTGDKAEILNTPEYYILASPDIHLGLKGHRIDLDGELFIPEANLRPRDVSGAVSASDDVVIVSAEGPSSAETRWLIYSQLRIRLGNFVKFSGFGLKGLLAGDITLIDAPQQPTIARGELSIINGEYRAYGQKLTVDRGRLLFFGGPVENPGLDIRAVRHVQDVTAGIMVRGALKSPQIQLFSEPAMSESDALSYLLTGQPINQATSAQGQQLYGAALSLGLASGGLLANQIGQRFGIDELSVQSGGNFGGGALVIRHYLSPKLYISYGVGLVEHFNIFLVRYQISRLWALEAESGVTSGADIVYTLERK